MCVSRASRPLGAALDVKGVKKGSAVLEPGGSLPRGREVGGPIVNCVARGERVLWGTSKTGILGQSGLGRKLLGEGRKQGALQNY